jgi:exodeoxyribonuclease VII small subunit
MPGETMTFKEAYGVLQEHAETLRNQTEPNIDDLLAIVEESVGAYKVCKERIDAVEKALQKALTDVGSEPAGRRSSEDSDAARPSQRKPFGAPAAAKGRGFDDAEDDIPF